MANSKCVVCGDDATRSVTAGPFTEGTERVCNEPSCGCDVYAMPRNEWPVNKQIFKQCRVCGEVFATNVGEPLKSILRIMADHEHNSFKTVTEEEAY